MSVVAELTLDALTKESTEQLVEYSRCLRGSCTKYPPPFGMGWYGEKYRSMALDPHWFAASLIANAQKEGDGSRTLWQLSGRTGESKTAELVRRHAIDESRHSMLYIAMLNLVFPDSVPGNLQPILKAYSPQYCSLDTPEQFPVSPEEHILDELIQMNIGEIRTRIHQLLLRPVIMAYCLPERRGKLIQVLDSLIWDETRHIEYTARLIENAIKSKWVNFTREKFAQRLNNFNEITLLEVGEDKFVGE